MKPLNDTRLRLLGPIGLYLFVAVFFRLDWYLTLPLDKLLINDPIALFWGLVCWQLARWVVLKIQARYPGLSNTHTRLLWLLACLPALVCLAWFLRHATRFLLDGHFFYFGSAVELSRTIGIQLFYHFIYFTIYEGWYILRQWQHETVEVNALENASLQSQILSLQHQVNPHFLFNSLNSLSALIADDPNRAELFLDELTTVFRYLLQASSRSSVTLGEELAFVRAYIHLLQARYDTGLQLDVAVDASQEEAYLVPLTLQTLIENVIRYNVILPEQPLRIRIYTEQGRLFVANTLQRKTLRVAMAGSGLTNLAMRYKLTNYGQLAINETAGWFVVSLPLVRELENALLPT
ncbi:sensor histidine kinase [Fibrella forsythiae]|uniref:Histidine kinase n=1 Tax=Fibrella forsythiae TaxID=2817061 RepID=A0ABS3JRE0_9BACT|nr:histidine kinase [Fibrella forsythiae]MBO0952579.1 histidine kinase [Fibrella forsythiae]